jgi:hypothetical protein
VSQTLLIDCAWTKPSAAAVKAAGYTGVIGYISRDPSKDLTAAQMKRYRAAGLLVGLVFETTAARAKAGRAAGRADCAFAEAEAAKRGYPPGCVIFYAVDFDATARQILPYFRGIKETHARYGWGAYGSAKVIGAVRPLAPAAAWQTVAWSGGVVSPHADIYQRAEHTRRAIKGVGRSAYDEDVLIRPCPLWGVEATTGHQSHSHPVKAKTPTVNVGRYSKALGALVGGIGTWLGVALADGKVTPTEWKALGVALVPALTAYLAPKNTPTAKP